MNPNRFKKKWQLFENSNFRKFHFLKIQIFKSYNLKNFNLKFIQSTILFISKILFKLKYFFHVQKCYSRTPCWITSKRWSWVIGMPSAMTHLDLKVFVFWWFNKGPRGELEDEVNWGCRDVQFRVSYRYDTDAREISQIRSCMIRICGFGTSKSMKRIPKLAKDKFHVK